MHQFTIRAGKSSSDPADVWIYGDIGGGWFGDGITAKDVARELTSVKNASELNVHINSYGGDVFDGIAIMNLLKNHGGTVNVQVDGIAASAASVVAMAGESITIHSGAQMMIHNPWSMSVGDANQMRADADKLEKVASELVGIYADRTGKDSAMVKGWMDAETWFNATEARDAGLATSVLEAPAVAACGGEWAKGRCGIPQPQADSKSRSVLSAMEMQMQLTRKR